VETTWVHVLGPDGVLVGDFEVISYTVHADGKLRLDFANETDMTLQWTEWIDIRDHRVAEEWATRNPKRAVVSAEVKEVLASGDGQARDRSLEGFSPPDPELFGFRAQVFIGSADDDRFDSFDVLVCSPPWFAEQVADGQWERFRSGLRVLPESIVVGAGLWFMRRWDEAEFKEALDLVCDSFSPGPDWGSVASRIGRLLPWEFDYKYDEAINRGDQRFPT
jgi:hypothetical protein